MQTIQNFVQKNLHALLLLITASGFMMLLVELIMMGHTGDEQRIAVIAAATGTALALVGIFAKRNLRPLLVVLFLALSLSGIYGTIEHAEEREHRIEEVNGLILTANGGEHEEKGEAGRNSKSAQEEDEEEEEEIGEELIEKFILFPPALSPLGLSGFAALGAVILLSKKDEKQTV